MSLKAFNCVWLSGDTRPWLSGLGNRVIFCANGKRVGGQGMLRLSPDSWAASLRPLYVLYKYLWHVTHSPNGVRWIFVNSRNVLRPIPTFTVYSGVIKNWKAISADPMLYNFL